MPPKSCMRHTPSRIPCSRQSDLPQRDVLSAQRTNSTGLTSPTGVHFQTLTGSEAPAQRRQTHTAPEASHTAMRSQTAPLQFRHSRLGKDGGGKNPASIAVPTIGKPPSPQARKQHPLSPRTHRYYPRRTTTPKATGRPQHTCHGVDSSPADIGTKHAKRK